MQPTRVFEEILAALAAQAAEFDGLIAGLDEDGWGRPSACEGWTIADVVLHVAQTDEMGAASAEHRFTASAARFGAPPDDEPSADRDTARAGSTGGRGGGTANAPGGASSDASGGGTANVPGDASSDASGGGTANATGGASSGAASGATVDDLAGRAVAAQRGLPGREVYARWRAASAAQAKALAAHEPGDRVPWVAGDLSALTLATTRLAELWIHSGDVAAGLGRELPATDRLKPIARLAWRTIPFAFSRAGRTLSGPVAVELTAPDGSTWSFAPDEPAATTVTGPALDFCRVAARRAPASATALKATGPDADAVLALVRTFA